MVALFLVYSVGLLWLELVEGLCDCCWDWLNLCCHWLRDLMKQLQYGCQQKLVNVFIMIYFVSALPVLMNMYTYKDSNLISGS